VILIMFVGLDVPLVDLNRDGNIVPLPETKRIGCSLRDWSINLVWLTISFPGNEETCIQDRKTKTEVQIGTDAMGILNFVQ
jgi:hypothetical protein